MMLRTPRFTLVVIFTVALTCTRTVDNHMLTLRQKLEIDLSHPSQFLTVHGLGYKFVP